MVVHGLGEALISMIPVFNRLEVSRQYFEDTASLSWLPACFCEVSGCQVLWSAVNAASIDDLQPRPPINQVPSKTEPVCHLCHL
jgi:hypothetical protein